MLDALAAGVLAAGALEAAAGALEAAAGVLAAEAGVLAAAAGDDELDEHPAASAAIAPTATPTAATRARLSPDIRARPGALPHDPVTLDMSIAPLQLRTVA
jgi:hypothetical protein